MVEDRNIDAVRQELVRRRGDSFDIGEIVESPQQQDIFIKVMQNPQQLSELLNITEEQATNIKAVITGAGAGLSARYLSKHFGDAIAGAFGGFVGGMVANKLFGGK